MESNVIYFYSLFFAILASSLGIILAPKMYMAAISLFCLICFSGVLYLGFNAKYIAIFQFILCGVFLCAYIILLLKKISRLNLNLKLAPPFKIIASSLFIFLFGLLTCLFFKEEYSNSLYSIFNFISEKSSDTVNFALHGFHLQLVILLVLVTAVVLRIFLVNVNEQSEDKQ